MADRHPQAEISPDKKPASFTSTPSPREAPYLIGARVRAARITAHLTQQELAGPTFSKSYISAVERGKMTPSLQALRILTSRLGVSLASVLGEGHLLPEHAASADAVSAAEQLARLSEAEHLLQQGRYEEALPLFEQAGQQVRTALAYEQYAQVLAAQGRYQEAYEQMARAVQAAAREE
jgi:transcriptional regulator with XRE-family HTH domain